MQTVNQSVEIISYVTDTPRSRVNQIARALIVANLLPKSSGKAIKFIDAKQLFGLLAATVLSDKVSDAPAIAYEFRSLPFEGEETGDGHDAGWAFTQIMNPDGPWLCCEVELSKTKNGFVAKLNGTMDGPSENEKSRVSFPYFRNQGWGGFCKRSVFISEQGIENLKNLFDRKDIQGMEFED